MPTTNTQEGQQAIYKEQHASNGATEVIASLGVIRLAGGAIDASAGRITFPPNLAKGYIPLQF